MRGCFRAGSFAAAAQGTAAGEVAPEQVDKSPAGS